MITYKKISDNEYEVTESKKEVSIVKLDFIEADIVHKDKLINELKNGIINLESEKEQLETLRDNLEKIK